MLVDTLHLGKIRDRENQYSTPADATDPRFHNLFQQDIYESMYFNTTLTELVTKQKWVDWKYIAKLQSFEGVNEACRACDLDGIMSIVQDWNDEVIMQFYATLQFHKEEKALTWMTCGVPYTASFDDFASVLCLPGLEDNSPWLHDEQPLQTSDILQFYLEKYVTNARSGSVQGLKPIYHNLNKLLRWTVLPKSGDSGHIRGAAWPLLQAVKGHRKFHVMGLIWEEIFNASCDKKRSLPYAPFIMKFIIWKTKQEFDLRTKHKGFYPIGDEQVKRKATQSTQTKTTSDEITLQMVFNMTLENSKLLLEINDRTKKVQYGLEDALKRVRKLEESGNSSKVPSFEDAKWDSDMSKAVDDGLTCEISSPIPSANSPSSETSGQPMLSFPMIPAPKVDHPTPESVASFPALASASSPPAATVRPDVPLRNREGYMYARRTK